jgi:hypothetical protein
VLSRWIESYSRRHEVAAVRVRRTVAFELVLAAFERAAEGDPWVVIKGGHAMEIEDLVRDASVAPLLDGDVTFEVRSAYPVGHTGAAAAVQAMVARIDAAD